MQKRLLGVHTSIAGGLPESIRRASELGCTALQIFSHNPRGWAIKGRAEGEIEAFRSAKASSSISGLFVHTSYLINLASSDKTLNQKSVAMVVEEMQIADEIGADYVVLHTGSASGEDPVFARQKAIASLSEVAQLGQWKAGLLLENTAGERGDITSRIPELSEIIEAVPEGLISGICFDTCHGFAAGYDLRECESIELLGEEILRYLGKGKVRLLHMNDSKGELGSHRDRHEHIGKGGIGLRGFKRLLAADIFSDVPIILETPKKEPEDDPRNLRTMRRLLLQRHA